MKNFPFDELIPDEYKPYYLIGVGILLLSASLFIKPKKNLLRQTGIATEGIIFSQDDLLDLQRSATVRFVTDNLEWITGKIDQDFQLNYIGQYKNGDKVKVYYEKNNPSNFYIETKQNATKGKVILLLAGLAAIAFALYQLFLANRD